MKKHFPALALCGLISLGLSSCSKDILTDDDSSVSSPSDKATSTLIVRTRSVSSADKGHVSLPVNVYVFNAKNVCVSTAVISEDGSSMDMKLARGTYNVYAVSGANDANYSLPSREDATPTSPVTLREDGTEGELMAGQSTVTMGKDQTNTLTLALKRRVMQLTSVVIKSVPESVTAMSVTFSPLYSSVLLNGKYASDTGSRRMELTKDTESDGEWKLESPCYLLEPSGDASITVEMTEGGSTRSYTYISKDELKANSHISIVGTYAYEFELSGTITGEEWGEDRKIEFDLADEDDVNTPSTPGSADVTSTYGTPVVNKFYADNSCFVVSSVDNGDGTVSYLLMTTAEKNVFGDKSVKSMTSDEIKERVLAALPGLEVEGVTGWRLPTREELLSVSSGDYENSLKSLASSSEYPSFGSYERYFYQKADGTVSALVFAKTDDDGQDYMTNSKLRAFAMVKVRK